MPKAERRGRAYQCIPGRIGARLQTPGKPPFFCQPCQLRAASEATIKPLENSSGHEEMAHGVQDAIRHTPGIHVLDYLSKEDSLKHWKGREGTCSSWEKETPTPTKEATPKQTKKKVGKEPRKSAPSTSETPQGDASFEGGSEATTQQKIKEVGKEPRQSAPSTSETPQGDTSFEGGVLKWQPNRRKRKLGRSPGRAHLRPVEHLKEISILRRPVFQSRGPQTEWQGNTPQRRLKVRKELQELQQGTIRWRSPMRIMLSHSSEWNAKALGNLLWIWKGKHQVRSKDQLEVMTWRTSHESQQPRCLLWVWKTVSPGAPMSTGGQRPQQ